MGVLIGFGIFLGVVVLYLIGITFLPFFKVAEIPVHVASAALPAPANRRDVEFSVDGDTVRSWLYVPERLDDKVPCVVMGHGLNGTRDMMLEQYAMKFAEAGWATLAIDYRHFGESDGKPRQLYHARKQVEDLKAAVSYVRGLLEIDADRVAWWGTSASGLYGICAAAEDHNIAAVIAQCAALDHKADSKPHLKRLGFGYYLRLFVHGQRDKVRMRFNMKPHIIPAYSSNGEISLVSAPGLVEGISRLAKHSKSFSNQICARSLLMPHPPDPIAAAEEVRCPVLILVCEKDEIVAHDSHVKVAEKLGDKADVHSYPIGHFDIYEGEHFERAVVDMVAFLQGCFAAGGRE